MTMKCHFAPPQPIKEASYVGIPTIAFCDTDSPLEWVVHLLCCLNPVHTKGMEVTDNTVNFV